MTDEIQEFFSYTDREIQYYRRPQNTEEVYFLRSRDRETQNVIQSFFLYRYPVPIQGQRRLYNGTEIVSTGLLHHLQVEFNKYLRPLRFVCHIRDRDRRGHIYNSNRSNAIEYDLAFDSVPMPGEINRNPLNLCSFKKVFAASTLDIRPLFRIAKQMYYRILEVYTVRNLLQTSRQNSIGEIDDPLIAGILIHLQDRIRQISRSTGIAVYTAVPGRGLNLKDVYTHLILGLDSELVPF